MAAVGSGARIKRRVARRSLVAEWRVRAALEPIECSRPGEIAASECGIPRETSVELNRRIRNRCGGSPPRRIP